MGPDVLPAFCYFRSFFLTMSSEAQLAATRQNSQLSTGPQTEAGKAKSSLNAVKTGLTGRTVLLPSDDAAAYEAHVARFFTEYAPANEQEQALVQSIADTEWRLLRIPSLEMSVYALGRLELASNFQEVERPASPQRAHRSQNLPDLPA